MFRIADCGTPDFVRNSPEVRIAYLWEH